MNPPAPDGALPGGRDTRPDDRCVRCGHALPASGLGRGMLAGFILIGAGAGAFFKLTAWLTVVLAILGLLVWKEYFARHCPRCRAWHEPLAVRLLRHRYSLRALRRRRQGRCVECGYNLTGNVSGVCPECGTPLGELPAASPGRALHPFWAIVTAVAAASGTVLLGFGIWSAYLFAFTAVADLRGDATAHAPQFSRETFRQIEKGMSREQVEDLVGKPLLCYRTGIPWWEHWKRVDCETCFDADFESAGFFVMSYATPAEHGVYYRVVYDDQGVVQEIRYTDDPP